MQPIADPFLDHADADRDVKSLVQFRSQLFRDFRSARRQDINILCHSRFVNVRIDGLSAEHNSIIAAKTR